MSVDSNNAWMVAISTQDLVTAVGNGEVNVASFYGHMQGRRMSYDVFLSLLKALRGNCTLQVLDLDHNEVGRWENGVAMLLDAIKHIGTLRQLNLNSCQVGDEDVDHLCRFLSHNDTLESLWLYGNNITFRGTIQLHKTLLTENSVLHTLNLRNNGLPTSLLQQLVYEPLKDDTRPRPLSLVEHCRLFIIQQRIPYKKGVFVPLSDDWQDVLCGDNDADSISQD